MKCTHCGAEISDEVAFCTNCGEPTALLPSQTQDPAPAQVAQGAGDAAYSAELGASLESAVQANEAAIGEIESHAQIVDEAAARWAEAEAAAVNDAQPEYPAPQGFAAPQADGAPDAPQGYVPPSYGQPQDGAGQSFGVAEGATAAGAAAAGAAAAGAAAGAPFYQQGASPNAHYSSQRSYEQDAYGYDTGQPEYRAPAYGQAGSGMQREFPQPATSRALAMVLYVSGLIGLIVGLCVRDKNDPFITHHLNNNVVLFIGFLISGILSFFLIGPILFIYLFVMLIMGMVSAYNGNTNELPLIGKIHILK